MERYEFTIHKTVFTRLPASLHASFTNQTYDKRFLVVSLLFFLFCSATFTHSSSLVCCLSFFYSCATLHPVLYLPKWSFCVVGSGALHCIAVDNMRKHKVVLSEAFGDDNNTKKALKHFFIVIFSLFFVLSKDFRIFLCVFIFFICRHSSDFLKPLWCEQKKGFEFENMKIFHLQKFALLHICYGEAFSFICWNWETMAGEKLQQFQVGRSLKPFRLLFSVIQLSSLTLHISIMVIFSKKTFPTSSKNRGFIIASGRE